MQRTLFALLLSFFMTASTTTNSGAQSPTNVIKSYVGKDGGRFVNVESAVNTFRAAISSGEFDRLAMLLGVDPEKAREAASSAATYRLVHDAALRKIHPRMMNGKWLLYLGPQKWLFPFPLVQRSDGYWSFDTVAGIAEMMERRMRDDELETISTLRILAQAQEDYASEDRDGDGLFEYAQSLLSSDNRQDGLYWDMGGGAIESPTGAHIDLAELSRARSGHGYFGYRYRILTEGINVLGLSYDFASKGNLIKGFAVLAWPVRYGETGIPTFVITHEGHVYEKDFGAGTEDAAASLRYFEPTADWSFVPP